MKIKLKKISHDELVKLSFGKRKKPIKPNILFKTLLKVISLPEMIFQRVKVNKIGMEKLGKKEPCLILMNHSCFLDLQIATSIFYPRSVNIVATTDAFIGRNWLFRQIGCIPTVKFMTDTALVKDMLYCIKKLKSSVLVFPEAGYTFDGTSTTLPDNLGKMVKMMNVPVVMVTTRGAFLSNPLYGGLRKRKCPQLVDMEYLLSKEDINQKTDKELQEIVLRAFSFDNFKYQQENNIVIDYNERAEGLNRVLYKCPCCKADGYMRSSKTKIKCLKCGKEYELTETGFMKAVEGETEFNHIPDWYKWERECVKEALLNNTYLLDEDVKICAMVDTYSIYELGDGHLVQDINGFHLTGLDGKIDYSQPAKHAYTINSDFYWYQIADTITIGNTKVQYFCFPKTERDVVTMARLAQEEAFKLANKK